MLTLRSQNGYNENGFFRFTSQDCTLDVYDGDTKVGEITSKKLSKFIDQCYKKKIDARTKYANLFPPSSIIDPKKPKEDNSDVFAVSINELGEAKCGRDVVKCTVSPVNGLNNYAFEFDNGFVIGVFGYKAVVNSNYFSTAEFRLFGSKETFGFGPEFTLSITIKEYTKDKISGGVYVIRPVPDSQDYQNGRSNVALVGAFELTQSDTVYRDESLGVVCNKTHYVKELTLCS